MVRSKYRSGSRMVLRQCPKTSRLMAPIMVVQAWMADTTVSGGMPGKRASVTGATASASSAETADGVVDRAETSGLSGLDDRAHHGRSGPGVGGDGVLGRLVARNGRPEDEAPLVRAGQRPAPDGPGHLREALEVGFLVTCGLVGGLFGALGQGFVGGQDEGAQQGVASVEVPVEGGGSHAQVTGDGAQGEGGGSVPGQVISGHGQDLPGHLLCGPAPGPYVMLTSSPAWPQCDVPTREHKYLTRTLFTL